MILKIRQLFWSVMLNHFLYSFVHSRTHSLLTIDFISIPTRFSLLVLELGFKRFLSLRAFVFYCMLMLVFWLSEHARTFEYKLGEEEENSHKEKKKKLLTWIEIASRHHKFHYIDTYVHCANASSTLFANFRLSLVRIKAHLQQKDHENWYKIFNKKRWYPSDKRLFALFNVVLSMDLSFDSVCPPLIFNTCKYSLCDCGFGFFFYFE